MKIESKESFNLRCKLVREAINLRKNYYGCISVPEMARCLKINNSSIYQFARGFNISPQRLELLINFFKENEPVRLELAAERLGMKKQDIMNKI